LCRISQAAFGEEGHADWNEELDLSTIARIPQESPHGFTSFPTAKSSTAVNDIESWLADRFLDT
jgi:hypothetical protein